MRIACVFVPSFAIAVERQADPRLAEQPLIVYERGAVIDASADTASARVLTVRQAKAACPNAVFIEANRALYRDVSEAMLDVIEKVSPLVEPAEPGTAYADILGLQGHFSDEFALAAAFVEAVRTATGLLPGVGIADGKFAASVAAVITPPGDAGIVPSGREREFLHDKDTSLLPFDTNITQRLNLLALRTLGDIAALPKTAVEAQFGRSGARLWELAGGIDSEPLRPRTPQETLHERLSFETPVVASEAMIMAGRQLIGRLVQRLKGRTARRMHLQLLADERIIWEKLETFREPTGDERQMILILKTRLSLLELPQGIDTVAITFTGIGLEMAKQARLFTDTQQNLNQIAEAIRQLRARYNRPMIYRVAEVDPRSRHPEDRSVLVPYDA